MAPPDSGRPAPGRRALLPPLVRVLAALGFVVVIALAPRPAWGLSAGGAVVLVLATVLSRARLGPLVRRLLWLEPFALSIALLSLFQAHGVQVFLGMLATSTLCLWCMILLTSTTTFGELLLVLRRCRAPSLLVTTLALTYRYLFLIQDELARMQRARHSRTFGPSRGWSWRGLAATAGQLFVRTAERAERVYAAMTARGWKT